jgi:hypothetical protein
MNRNMTATVIAKAAPPSVAKNRTKRRKIDPQPKKKSLQIHFGMSWKGPGS